MPVTIDSTGITINSIKQVSAIPIGSIIMYPYAGKDPNYTPNVSYLLCDGRALTRTTYPELFNVINTTYGTGSGSREFNIPNLQERMPMGSSITNMNPISNDPLKNNTTKTGGNDTIRLNQQFKHTHTLDTSLFVENITHNTSNSDDADDEGVIGADTNVQIMNEESENIGVKSTTHIGTDSGDTAETGDTDKRFAKSVYVSFFIRAK